MAVTEGFFRQIKSFSQMNRVQIKLDLGIFRRLRLSLLRKPRSGVAWHFYAVPRVPGFALGYVRCRLLCDPLAFSLSPLGFGIGLSRSGQCFVSTLGTPWPLTISQGCILNHRRDSDRLLCALGNDSTKVAVDSKGSNLARNTSGIRPRYILPWALSGIGLDQNSANERTAGPQC